MGSQKKDFLLAAGIYFLCVFFAKDIFVIPQQIRIASFLPPIFGLMWGPAGAGGVFAGEIINEMIHHEWMSFWNAGISVFTGQLLLQIYRSSWAFFAAYMTFRLWHSLFVRRKEPLFSLQTDILLKFVLIIFITTLSTSLFLGLTTDGEELAKIMRGSNVHFNPGLEYAWFCFINDFDLALLFSTMCFFILISLKYPFYLPSRVGITRVRLQRRFDLGMSAAVLIGIVLCLPFPVFADKELNDLRMLFGAVLFIYAFRPLSVRTDGPVLKANPAREGYQINRLMAGLFYGFFICLFILLDLFLIHDMDHMDTWQMFNTDCLSMMAITLTALLYMLMRFRNSIMTNIMLLEVITVFVSASVLGCVSFLGMDRMISDRMEDSLQKMSIVCRERLARPFDGVRISVNSMHDLAADRLYSYERLVNDAAYRQAYLSELEHIFEVITANTDGSIGYYLRCDPGIDGAQGGFSWGREAGRWEGVSVPFHERTPVDLDKYEETDRENVGWYYIPIQQKSATWIEPYLDPAVDNYVISYVVPFYAKNRLVGVIGMDIDFDYIIHEIRRMSAYEAGYVYLVDRNGRVLYHPEYAQGTVLPANSGTYEAETYLLNGIWLGIAGSSHDVYANRNNLLIYLVVVMLFVAMAVSVFSIWLASRGVRPLLALTQAAKAIAAGNLEVDLSYQSQNEIGTLVASLREMVSKLEGYVYRDPLTGLRNTAAYMRNVHQLDERRKHEKDLQYAVAVFDANFLKKVNDNYGHEAGNELIRRSAMVICRVFAHSPVYRIGGDEFVAILEREDYEKRQKLVEEFKQRIAAEVLKVGSDELPVSVACGVGVFVGYKVYADVFHEADNAMYEDKAAIKGTSQNNR